MVASKTEPKNNETVTMVVVFLLVVTVLLGLITMRLAGQKEQVNKPKTEKMFACGDYCPGPAEKYMKTVYSGVQTEADCLKYGGRWSSFTGWGTTYYCEVK